MKTNVTEDILKVQWNEIKGELKTKWSKLTDSDITAVNGNTEKLIGILQTRYVYSHEKAQTEFEGFIRSHKK